jgi:hypothetical protein
MAGNPSVSFHRSRAGEIGHHFTQACHWLDGATSPLDTTAISYAAFELRLEIERIGVEYLQAVNGGRIEQDDVRVIESFKRLENRIYRQDGHQGEIDRKLEFLDIFFDALKVPIKLVRPNFGRLADCWHRCSNYCHITWTLAATREPAKVFPLAIADLREVKAYLSSFALESLAWPGSLSQEFTGLRDRYARGELTREQVLAEIYAQGVYVSLEYPGQEPQLFRLPDPSSSG